MKNGSGKWDRTTDLGLMSPTQQFFNLDICYQIELKDALLLFFITIMLN